LHAQNIIHRDLKPENVLLRGDVPCIADFGVSRIVETTSLEISQAGTNTAGSPLYMSPESFERIKPAPQIDIWSAGVMLFEMLSGKTPYSADTIPGLIYEIVTKEPRSLPADIPESFHHVVKKALAKEVDDRFATAREMREALMKALYSQHYSASALEAPTLIPKNESERKIDNKASCIHLLKTLPINKAKPDSEAVQNNKAKVGSKTLTWIGLGAGAVLAGSIGIYTLTQSNVVGNTNQQNNSVSNQAIAVEINNNNSENAANIEMIAKPQNIANPGDSPKAEKGKAQTDQRSASTKAETAPKKVVTKPAVNKKKVTLDDLINEK
jgi:serine/threonine protein kinase